MKTDLELLTEAQEQIATLTADLEAANSLLEQAEKETAQWKLDGRAFDARLAESGLALEKVKAELLEAKREVETLKATAKTAEQRAQEIAAGSGCKSATVTNAAQEKADEAILEEFLAIKEPIARARFYDKHKATIVKFRNRPTE